jgi:hypothetical protein
MAALNLTAGPMLRDCPPRPNRERVQVRDVMSHLEVDASIKWRDT